MWKNYRPMVPFKFQDDSMYSKPDEKTMAKVKDKKIYRAETREVLKARKYGKDTIEDRAFGGGEMDVV